MKTQTFQNRSEHVVRVPSLELEVQPGGYCEIPLAYAQMRRAPNGKPTVPSIIASLAPQLEPAVSDAPAKRGKARD